MTKKHFVALAEEIKQANIRSTRENHLRHLASPQNERVIERSRKI